MQLAERWEARKRRRHGRKTGSHHGAIARADLDQTAPP